MGCAEFINPWAKFNAWVPTSTCIVQAPKTSFVEIFTTGSLEKYLNSDVGYACYSTMNDVPVAAQYWHDKAARIAIHIGSS